MKKALLAAVAAFALCAGLLAGCSGSGASASASAAGSASASAAGDKVKVVCATFPAYDWVCQIAGGADGPCDITYLMESGVDLHSYQPTVEDIAKISDCDLFVYVGGESDGWAQDAVEAAANPDMHTVNMLEAIGDAAVEEEIVEGIQEEAHDHDHGDGDEHDADHEDEAAHEGENGAAAEEADHDHEGAAVEEADHDADHEEEADHDHEGEEGPELDEHVWLSLRNAQVLVDAIAEELSAIDADNADTYAANAKAYDEQLAALDARYAEAVKGASKDTVVFADRFPFRYLVDDYGIRYYAAFVGCSAETEASFETVAFLAEKVDELGLSSIFIIENSDGKIADTVIANTKDKSAKTLVMDSLQSTQRADIDAGKTYLGAMENNLSVLETALA